MCYCFRSAAASAILAAILSIPDANAAVRKCHATVSSAVVVAPTERAAKTQALEQWRAAALKSGAGFDSWRLAHQKILKCLPKQGGFECVALGQPCIIDQSARSPPKAPGDKGTGI